MPCWCSAPPASSCRPCIAGASIRCWRSWWPARCSAPGLGSFKDIWPSLQWVTITDAKNVASIAELGVVFLMFLIGLELSYERLLTMRRLVFGLGSLQVVLSAIAISIRRRLLGSTGAAAVIIGLCLALSSTAIVIELLSEQRRLMSATGRASFAVLLLQDLAVGADAAAGQHPGADNGPSIATGVMIALAQAALAVALIVIIGRLLLRPFFRLVAATETPELFVAATLFVIVGTGVAAAVAGCRWRSAPSSPASSWPRANSASRSRSPSIRSRACCSACSSSRSAWASTFRRSPPSRCRCWPPLSA
jgi:hypothetical protein